LDKQIIPQISNIWREIPDIAIPTNNRWRRGVSQGSRRVSPRLKPWILWNS